MPVGAARLAYEHFTGTPGSASQAYDATMAALQKQTTAMKAKHPYAYGAGELGGAGASMMLAGPEEAAATLAGRVGQAMKVGAGYGAASGASEGAGTGGLPGALTGAVEGGIEGGVGGAAGEVGGTALGRLGSAAYGYIGQPIAATIRGWTDPAQEAARRVAGALYRDYPQVSGGTALGLTPQQWATAKAAGEPVSLMDLGGETTRALMRSAANTSPEGRAELNSVIQDRFQAQNDRAGVTARSLIPGGANTLKTKAQLEAEYDAERGAAYGKAYQAGDRPIWSPELERLAGAPVVTSALQDAITNWKNWQVRDGFGGMNSPVQVTDDGRFIWSKNPPKTPSGEGFWDRVQREQDFGAGTQAPAPPSAYKPETGVPAYPNLQLWDYAQRNLSDAASRAQRTGDNQAAAQVGGLAGQLKAELDKQVPQFADARGVAARYFGGNNAIDAGVKALSGKDANGKAIAPEQLRLIVNNMKPAEQGMFQESFADALARKAESAGDNRDITNSIFNSPQQRKIIGAVFGPQGIDTMQAFVNRERIFDAARKALGNSTTARQMIEAGLAGGAGGAFLSGGDPRETLEAAGTAAGAGLAGGASGLIRHGVLTGAKTALGYVDRRTAGEVARLLASNDPSELMRGLQIATKNQRVADGLRNLASRASGYFGAQRGSSLPQIQLPGSAGAQPQQQNVPRVEDQQQNGGRIQQQQRAKGGGVKHQGSLIGARTAKDGRDYVEDRARPGKFLLVVPR
jgi:hypothetical protein